MKLRINGCLLNLESLSDDNLLSIVLNLNDQKRDLDGQIAALAAERFSRRQSP